jgi:NADH-quinone oxidoreductase subunit H
MVKSLSFQDKNMGSIPIGIIKIKMLLNFVLSVLLALPMIAFFTLAERKLIASVQRRRGPNVVGFWGLLQAIADGLKLAVKEIVVPSKANRDLFIIAPTILLALSFLHWAVIPLGYYDTVIDSPYSVLFILAISSLGVYGIILGGWSSNSKYAFLGSLRSAAQMISYEISLSLIILPVILVVNSFNLNEIVFFQQQAGWLGIALLPLFVAFFISMLAETNRTPFDLPEAEAEIVAGYNVEYSSITFALFFLGEYGNMLVLAFIITIFYLGGWIGPMMWAVPLGFWYILKVLVFCFLYIFIRANLPRYRYDQLMSIGWKVLLPMTLGYLVLVAGLLFFAVPSFSITDAVVAYQDIGGVAEIN